LFWGLFLSFVLLSAPLAYGQAAPAQWNYKIVGGTATATYPGNVVVPSLINQLCLGTDGTGTLIAGTCTAPPIPTTSALPVGWSGVMYNASGSSVANSGTVAGASLYIYVDNGVAQTGTWKNITGAAVANDIAGLFVRTN
jgi:hypothetical protein